MEIINKIKYLWDENRTKNGIIKSLLENLKLMRNSTISDNMEEYFNKTENSEFIIPKKKSRQTRQASIKAFQF